MMKILQKIGATPAARGKALLNSLSDYIQTFAEAAAKCDEKAQEHRQVATSYTQKAMEESATALELRRIAEKFEDFLSE